MAKGLEILAEFQQGSFDYRAVRIEYPPFEHYSGPNADVRIDRRDSEGHWLKHSWLGGLEIGIVECLVARLRAAGLPATAPEGSSFGPATPDGPLATTTESLPSPGPQETNPQLASQR